MRAPSIDIDALGFIAPRSVRSYLESNYWSKVDERRRDDSEIWQRQTEDGKAAFLMLPLDTDVPDYSYRIYDLIRVISTVEKRAESKVFESLRAPSELAKRKSNDVINFSLKFEDAGKREVLANRLGKLLTTFQGLVNSLAQYTEGCPSAKGPIPKFILDKSQLSVVSTFEGSFGLRFVPSNPTEQLSYLEEPLVRQSIQELFLLLKVSEDESLLKESLVRLRKRTASNFRNFLVALSALEVDSLIEWGSPDKDMDERVEFSRLAVAKALQTVTRTIVETPDEFEILGEWIGGNKRTRKFEVRDIEASDESDGTYKGKIAPAALKSTEIAQMGQLYSLRLLNEPELNEATEELTSKYTLLELKSLPESEQNSEPIAQ
ncbi:MAG: hypothetical protein AAFN40_04550 [Cyanobacteria bacterium J06560_6]